MAYVPAYPDNFPCPTWEYALSRTAYRRSVRYESGWGRTRDQFPQTGGGVSLTFVMTTEIYARWMDWMLANGYQWFTMALEPGIGEDLTHQQIRITEPIPSGYATFDRITVSVGGEFHAL